LLKAMTRRAEAFKVHGRQRQIVRNFNVRVHEVTMSLLDWHYTLGHAHFGALKDMTKNGDIVKGLPFRSVSRPNFKRM